MVDKEILAGLRHAMSRGEDLQKAMLSLWNAGYDRELIMEAARVIQAEQLMRTQNPSMPSPSPMTSQRTPQSQQKTQPQGSPQKASAPISSPGQQTQTTVMPGTPPHPGMAQPTSPQNTPPQPQQQRMSTPPLSSTPQGIIPPQQIPAPGTAPQNVSSYGGEKKKSSGGTVLLVFLIIILLLLVGGLGLSFVFREQIINFFNGSF